MAALFFTFCLAACSQASKSTPPPEPASTPAPTAQPQLPVPSTVPPVSETGREEEENAGRRIRRRVSRVLRNYTNGMEMMSSSAALAMVDRDRFIDYPRFEEELTNFLRSLGEMRLFVREINTQLGNNSAVMVVDVRMVFTSRQDASLRGERASQITFDFQRTDRGWKIIEINPRNFFLP
jgi:hypothetical protein